MAAGGDGNGVDADMILVLVLAVARPIDCCAIPETFCVLLGRF